MKAPRPNTKKWYIQEIQNLLDEYDQYNDKLWQLVEEGQVNSGCLLTMGKTRLYTYRWLYGMDEGTKCRLYGWVFEETKVSEFSIMLEWLQKDMETIKSFLLDDTRVGWAKNNKEEI